MKHQDLIAIDIHTHAEVSSGTRLTPMAKNTTVQPTSTLAQTDAQPSMKRWLITASARSAW